MVPNSSGPIANIGPRERSKRLVFGIAAFTVSVVIAVLCAVTRAPPLVRLPLFFPLFFAALGFFQARDRT